jgi:NADH:ubiquinone oxidoreductase subunit K
MKFFVTESLDIAKEVMAFLLVTISAVTLAVALAIVLR